MTESKRLAGGFACLRSVGRADTELSFRNGLGGRYRCRSHAHGTGGERVRTSRSSGFVHGVGAAHDLGLRVVWVVSAV